MSVRNVLSMFPTMLTFRRSFTFTTCLPTSGTLSKPPVTPQQHDDNFVQARPGPMISPHTTCEYTVNHRLLLDLTVHSYLYGGFAAEGPGGFDDVYVLSMPSFKWINVFNGSNGTSTYQHGACSANVINRDQMLIIGGWFTSPSNTDCDSPGSQGQHNSKLAR